MPKQANKEGMTELPMQTRAASVGTINDENRTCNLVWTTGGKVRRYDYMRGRFYVEELPVSPECVRMERLTSGRAPFLNSHCRYDLSDQLGVVESASIENGQGIATARFSKREEVNAIWQDVKEGIIRNISVGYAIHAIEMIPPEKDGEDWIYRATDWEPLELSLVTVPADGGAGTRSQPDQQPGMATTPCLFFVRQLAAPAVNTEKGNNMPQANEGTRSGAPVAAPVVPQDNQAQIEAARAEGMRMEAERQTAIRDAVRMAGLEPGFADALINNRDMDGKDAGMACLNELHKRSAGSGATVSPAHIVTVQDQTDIRRAAMSDAILLRANPNALTDKDQIERARQYRGMNLIDMARAAIEAGGGKVAGFARHEIASIALNVDQNLRVRAGMNSTSDFPEVLGNTVGRTLRRVYDAAPKTFTPFCTRSTAPDFKQVARVQLSDMSGFEKVIEGEEYKMATMGESAEKYALVKYGRIIPITMETLVNDDLNAFDRIPRIFANKAAQKESDIVYGILTGNPNMADEKALFHSDHKNLTSPGTAISDTSLTAARAMMRKQKDLKDGYLNLTPVYLIVGPDNEGLANKYTSAEFVAAASVNINPKFNTSLEVIVDPRIIGNAWYMSASPNMVDTIEYAYLEGENGLFTEQKQGFEVDGLQIKARLVFAAKAIDWRGLYKNNGAS
ncbi:prohead protease/major capsid protein fusion protein [Oxalobacter formigenes]